MHSLSARKVETLKSPGRYGDGGGLYLVVSPGGSKSWVLRVVVRGRRRDMGLGGLAWVSLAEARDMARHYRAIARRGGDPLAERVAEKPKPTFEELTRAVHQSLQGQWKNEADSRYWLRLLERYAFPDLGARAIDTIEAGDVLGVLQPIWINTPEAARRLRQRMRQVFQTAKARGIYPGDNPVDIALTALPKQNRRVKHFTAMSWEDVPAFMVELRQQRSVAAMIVEFAIVTAVRSTEARAVRWSEIAGDVWTIPAERTKAADPHRVPLSAYALEILERARGLDDLLVFPGQKFGKPHAAGALRYVLSTMGKAATPHGFRSAFRDWVAEETDAPREIAELCLAHQVGNAVERAYRRSDLFAKRRDLMEQWGRFCFG